MKSNNLHCLSFDIEEHFHASAFDSPMRRRHWEQFESRVERNTRGILDLLGQRDVHATFFVLGWVAERHPNLVRQIARDGHEIACHGYDHEILLNQTPEQFRADVKKAKTILEDLIGRAVFGYRAPSFTLTTETSWSLQILVEEGYAYDSSFIPVVHDGCGSPGEKRGFRRVQTAAGSLWEVPPSSATLLGMRVPVGGGDYLRLYPFPLFRWLLKRVEAQGRPVVLFCHPWELDPEQPRMNGPWWSRFRHYTNLHQTKGRLAALLSELAFAPIRECIEPIRQLYQQQSKDSRSTRPGHQASSPQVGHVVCG